MRNFPEVAIKTSWGSLIRILSQGVLESTSGLHFLSHSLHSCFPGSSSALLVRFYYNTRII